MSLILDALKRAERERHAERSAALEDLPARAAPRRRRWGRWLVLAVLLFVVGAIALSIARRPRPATQVAARPGPAQRPAPKPQAPPAQAPAPVVTPAPAAPTPAPAQPPTEAPIQMRPQPTVVPGTEGVASLDDLTPDSDVELEPAAPASPPTVQARPPPELTADPTPAPEEPEPEAEEPVAPAPAPPAASASRPVPPALTQKAPVRKLREMPPDYRADFPALTIEVHVFEPGRRFVMINGRRYRDGERMAEGPQIVEIVREGIVVDYRGERVLVTLGR